MNNLPKNNRSKGLASAADSPVMYYQISYLWAVSPSSLQIKHLMKSEP